MKHIVLMIILSVSLCGCFRSTSFYRVSFEVSDKEIFTLSDWNAERNKVLKILSEEYGMLGTNPKLTHSSFFHAPSNPKHFRLVIGSCKAKDALEVMEHVLFLYMEKASRLVHQTGKAVLRGSNSDNQTDRILWPGYK